jgi:hypothetical protein
MATMWGLIQVSLADAARAEELIHDLAARRELRIDPEAALAGFSLWPGRAARDVGRVERREERRRLVHPARRAETQDAA